MNKTEAGSHAGTEPVRTPASCEVSPAARKFAEYLARRMRPMIEHAVRANVSAPTDTAAELGASQRPSLRPTRDMRLFQPDTDTPSTTTKERHDG